MSKINAVVINKDAYSVTLHSAEAMQYGFYHGDIYTEIDSDIDWFNANNIEIDDTVECEVFFDNTDNLYDVRFLRKIA